MEKQEVIGQGCNLPQRLCPLLLKCHQGGWSCSGFGSGEEDEQTCPSHPHTYLHLSGNKDGQDL